jgi:hypothetical protein
MKKLILPLLCLFFVSCTRHELKDLGLKEAQNQYDETLNKEIEGMSFPGVLRDNYLAFLKKTADFEVEDVKMSDPDHATVSVRVEAVAMENRKTLAQIASTLDPGKAKGFNMGNAVNLIEQQPGQVKGKKESLYFLKYHKEGSGWALDK